MEFEFGIGLWTQTLTWIVTISGRFYSARSSSISRKMTGSMAARSDAATLELTLDVRIVMLQDVFGNIKRGLGYEGKSLKGTLF